MRTSLSGCAVGILITGSISSISGAEADLGGCAAPPPTSAAAAIEGLQAGPAASVGYREEIHHPALAQPEVASGTLSMTADGRLVRDQHRPGREISEIGESFLSVRRGPDGPDAPENLLPIPSEMRPMLDAIRGVVGGDAEAITAAFGLELVASAPLWRVRLVPNDTAARGIEIVVAGCGARLRGMEVRQPGGVRRVIRFERQP